MGYSVRQFTEDFKGVSGAVGYGVTAVGGSVVGVTMSPLDSITKNLTTFMGGAGSSISQITGSLSMPLMFGAAGAVLFIIFKMK